jgi:hypothetical protein
MNQPTVLAMLNKIRIMASAELGLALSEQSKAKVNLILT